MGLLDALVEVVNLPFKVVDAVIEGVVDVADGLLDDEDDD